MTHQRPRRIKKAPLWAGLVAGSLRVLVGTGSHNNQITHIGREKFQDSAVYVIVFRSKCGDMRMRKS